MKRFLVFLAVLWSFIPGIAFATPPAAQPIDTDWFYPSWVLHEPGSSTITVYGTSDRAGTIGFTDHARLKATDNGVSNTYTFSWVTGKSTAGSDQSLLVCPSGSFCAGKALALNNSGAIAKCDITGDALSGCSNVPSFVASGSLSLTQGMIIAQKSSNDMLYLVNPTTGASTLMSSICTPPGKISTSAGGLAGAFLYLSSDREGALTDPGDGLPYLDIFRITWNGLDCTGSATNINNAGTGYAAINTGPGLEIGAVDPLTGSIYYRDWATDYPFVAKKEKDCGDGFIEEGEDCDPNAKDVYGSPPDDSKWQLNAATCLSVPGGFTGGTLKCNNVTCKYDTSSCTAPASCGDGVKNGTDACDGLDLGGASCTSVPGGFSGGTLACSGSCTFNTSGCYKCGDGTINPGEVCDGGSFGGATCSSIKGPGWTGSLTCSACAAIDSSSCVPPSAVCGDGTKNGSESCDGLDLGGASCTSVPGGFSGGTLACSGSCTFNTSGCYKCGDGTINPGEVCDGGSFGGATCSSIKGPGWTGSLTCSACSSILSSACVPPAPVCGNGVKEDGEECDPPEVGTCSVLGEGYTGTPGCSALCKLVYDGCTAPESCGNGSLDAGEQCDGSVPAGKTCETELGTGWTGSLACSSCIINKSGCSFTWGLKNLSGACSMSGTGKDQQVGFTGGSCTADYWPIGALMPTKIKWTAVAGKTLLISVVNAGEHTKVNVPYGVDHDEVVDNGNKYELGGGGESLGVGGTIYSQKWLNPETWRSTCSEGYITFSATATGAPASGLNLDGTPGKLPAGYGVDVNLPTNATSTPPWLLSGTGGTGGDGGSGGDAGSAGDGGAGSAGEAGNGGAGEAGHGGSGGSGGVGGETPINSDPGDGGTCAFNPTSKGPNSSILLMLGVMLARWVSRRRNRG